MWQNKEGKEWRGVILFERTQFKTIAAHDNYIHNLLLTWAEQHKNQGYTLWILGDFGNVSYLYWINEIKAYGIIVNFIYGNHDLKSNRELFELYFDNVYDKPQYLTDRIILSHEPVWPCPASMLNIHGHLHAARLDSDQHLCVSIHVAEYNIITGKAAMKQLGKIPKVSYKFLEEPYADHYIILQDRNDIVYDKKTGKINLQKSIEKFNKAHPDMRDRINNTSSQ